MNQGWGRHLLPHTGPSWLCRKRCLSGGGATLASGGPQFLSLEHVLMAGGKVGLQGWDWAVWPWVVSLLLRLFPHLLCDGCTALPFSLSG